MINRKKTELLAPAGSLQKLKTAILYGADAVYCGGKEFGLRVAAENLSIEDFAEGVCFAHERGAKVYVTLNIMPRSEELPRIGEYAKALSEVGVDGAIISDPGVFDVVAKMAPEMERHISTQANNLNSGTLNFWHKLGATRVVLARELSLAEIAEIRDGIPDELELEAFVHGAMCISYSGRCLLSSYLTGRDGNRGACTQPCRWKYHLVEEKRPGVFLPIEEDEQGTYLMNSKDMCMIRRLPEVLAAGVHSLKIEGRVKSELYVATIVGAYRRVLDRYLRDPENFVFDEADYEEVCKVSHRTYFDGFLDGVGLDGQIPEGDGYDRAYTYAAFVEDYDAEKGMAYCTQRNKFCKGEKLEVISPNQVPKSFIVEEMYDEKENEIEATSHPYMKFSVKIPFAVSTYAMMRKGEE